MAQTRVSALFVHDKTSSAVAQTFLSVSVGAGFR